MAKLMHWAVFVTLLSVNQLLAQEPKDPRAKSTQSGPNPVSEFFRSLDWWIWALLVLLIVLIVVFIKVRKSQEDD